MPLPDSQKSVMICPFVLTQYWHWTDRRTDRHTNKQTDRTCKTISCSAYIACWHAIKN